MPNQQNVSIFVDVQNIYYTTRQQFNRNFDYNKFWRLITENRKVMHAIAYATDRGDKKQKEFQKILRAIGFDVKLKPYIERMDGTAKADWDVGITIDVMELAKNSDIIVLASGDGDFDLLLSHVKQKYDTKFELYSVENLTSISLIREANRYFPITDELLLK
mgnify:CR=1 FL=1|jgi:uncharacterized LabA/DUF88 family protein